MRQNGVRPGRTRYAHGGRAKKNMGGVMRRDERSGYYPSDMGMAGGAMYKKGGSVKKQGYKDRKDESIAMRIRKKELRNNLELLLTNLMEDGEAKLRSLAKSISSHD